MNEDDIFYEFYTELSYIVNSYFNLDEKFFYSMEFRKILRSLLEKLRI